MHIFFSGIGGAGIGPLALIAQKAGYEVSGSDKQSSQYIEYLKKHGIEDIGIGQVQEFIKHVHQENKINWFVYSSAVEKENPNHPELVFCRENDIKMSKRDELLNEILSQKKLKLIAIAGTHGKTTTTAMAIWLFKQLGIPISYSVGAKISFGDMGAFEEGSEYFVYECDEFDRNFLAFNAYISLITGVAHDHHEIFPTEKDYFDAFKQFLNQSQWNVVWNEDSTRLNLKPADNLLVLSENDPEIDQVKLAGLYNRRDAFLVAQAVHELTKEPLDKLLNLLSDFPGVSRRFEKITDGLYTDYAHTPEKISGVMSVAKESLSPGQKLVVVYEPLTNRRMHYMKQLHRDVFEGADKIYWVPSYLAREEADQKILSPAELITELNPAFQKIAEPAELNDDLESSIQAHLDDNDLIVCLSGGGGGSLDEWLRKNF